MIAMRNLVLMALVAAPLSFAAACSSSSETSKGTSAAGDPGAPSPPSGLEATQLGGGIHVTWKDNSKDEAEFELERKEGSGSFAKVASVVFDTVQFHDTAVSAGKAYTYRARAVSSGGARSAFSNEVTMDAPTSASGPYPRRRTRDPARTPRQQTRRRTRPTMGVLHGVLRASLHVAVPYVPARGRT